MVDELKERLNGVGKRLEDLDKLLDIEAKQNRCSEIEKQMASADFWSDTNQANKLVQELKGLKTQIERWETTAAQYKELSDLAQITTDKDIDIADQIKRDLASLEIEIDNLELKTFFSGEYDINNAILSINAGAGGTEACDWANMLLRMYNRWAQSHKFNFSIVDILSGEEAGIKNVTATVIGDYAYGNLKSEAGVHRLVRISPFDANKRRHTSFASVEIIPQVSENIDIEIKEEDIKIDTFRSSGAGGQHVNKTDSAVRITHIPTGIVVACQNERSQHQNKYTALQLLKANLFEIKRREQEERLNKSQPQKRKIEWGSQIRSYVMHPYSLVKDHRTDFETGNVQAVMDGRIDEFISAYLRKFRE